MIILGIQCEKFELVFRWKKTQRNVEIFCEIFSQILRIIFFWKNFMIILSKQCEKFELVFGWKNAQRNVEIFFKIFSQI